MSTANNFSTLSQNVKINPILYGLFLDCPVTGAGVIVAYKSKSI